MPAPDAPALYAVIGNPIAHSQSPFIHAEFARQTGQHIEYTRVLCPLDGFRQTIDAFVAAGGRGCNITVPFKFEAPPLARRLSPRAALAQAANVLSFDQGADGAGGWSAETAGRMAGWNPGASCPRCAACAASAGSHATSLLEQACRSSR